MYSIVHPNLKNGIIRLAKYAIAVLTFPILFCFLTLSGSFPLTACYIFSGIFIFISLYALYLIIPVYKISRSYSMFLDDRIIITNHSGKIWRIILYSEIKRIKIMELEGYMHGYHGVDGRGNYIIVYTDSNSILCNSFVGHYKSKGYFPIFYQKNLIDELYAKLDKYYKQL